MGVIAGFLAGLFGVGGGILIVPGLVLLLGQDQRLAHGTSLAAVVPIAAGGLIGFATQGSVDWPAAGLLTVGAAAGAVLGTQALHRLSVRALQAAFALLLLATAVRLFIEVPEAAGRGALDPATGGALVALGVLAGVVAGLFGVGGGIVTVPGLVLLFSVADAVAKGTSLLVILPTAVVGTARNLRFDNVDLPVAAVTGTSGVVSAFVAAHITVGMDPRLSSVLFAVLLVLVSLRLLVEGARGAPRSSPGSVASPKA